VAADETDVTIAVMDMAGLGLGMAAPSRLVVVSSVTSSFLNGPIASRLDFPSWLAILL
jgi:hypothetical protein